MGVYDGIYWLAQSLDQEEDCTGPREAGPIKSGPCLFGLDRDPVRPTSRKWPIPSIGDRRRPDDALSRFSLESPGPATRAEPRRPISVRPQPPARRAPPVAGSEHIWQAFRRCPGPIRIAAPLGGQGADPGAGARHLKE